MNKSQDFFRYSGGVLHAGGVSLEKIADDVGTPAYVYSATAMLDALERLERGLKGIDHQICFAEKSNSNLAVLKLLSDAGAGMDLVSGGELFRAKRAGVPSNRIVFSGVGKTEAEIKDALLQKIFSFNVESEPELAAISRIAMGLGTRATIALRFNPDVNAKTHPYISTGLKKNKFGLQSREILDIVAKLDRFPGIVLRGISIHIGSQLLSLAPLSESFVKLKELVLAVEKSLPEPLRYLDLGGGVGISYRNEKSPEIAKYCALIQKHFGPRCATPRWRARYKIVLEPGRLITGNSGVLVSRVVFRKKRKSKDFLIIDAGMNDLVRPALYGSFHDIIPVKTRSPDKKVLTDVVGPVCETSDCFATNRKISAKLAVGDMVAILSSGAYGFTMSGNYNSRPRPAEVLVQNNAYRLIRKRESYEDLIRGEFP